MSGDMSVDTQRLRITFSKEGPLKYCSHLELMKVWERALRRAGLPLAYSGGYNPRPKMQLARALPLGHSAGAELLDIWLEEQRSVDALSSILAKGMPEGLSVNEVRQVDPQGPAMQTQIVATEYRVKVELPSGLGEAFIEEWGGVREGVEARIEHLLAEDDVQHERRGKRYNLRPLIEELRLGEVIDGEVVLEMRLSSRPGATGRPEAVLDVLGLGDVFARYRRKRLMTRSFSQSGAERQVNSAR